MMDIKILQECADFCGRRLSAGLIMTHYVNAVHLMVLYIRGRLARFNNGTPLQLTHHLKGEVQNTSLNRWTDRSGTIRLTNGNDQAF